MMSKGAKTWLIVAVLLVLIGCVVFGGAMIMSQWDFTKFSTKKYETNRYEVSEPYQNIQIVADTADIVLVPSENESSAVTCYEHKSAKHSVSVKDGTLVIEVVDERKWYEYIGISFRSPKITVCVPEGEYGTLSLKSSTGNVVVPKEFAFDGIDISVSTGEVSCRALATGEVKIESSTGNVTFGGASAGSVELSTSTGNVTVSDTTVRDGVRIRVSTGDTELSRVTCKSVTSSGKTGDILLENVLAEETLSIERSTGNVKFEGSDAAQIFVKTDTGSVKGTLLSDKVFFARSDTGSVRVPEAVTGGRCEITTDTGDIKIEIQP